MSCAACHDTMVVVRWRHAGYDKPPTKELTVCPLCATAPDVEKMNPEQLTLYLARCGTSPEDVRRSLEKAMTRVRSAR